MDTGIAVVVSAGIAAVATIAAAVITAHARKEPTSPPGHTPIIGYYPLIVAANDIDDDHVNPKTSPLFRIIRAVAGVFFFVLFFIGINLISGVVILWIDPSFEIPGKKMLTLLLLTAAALLLIIARWVFKRFKLQ